MFGVRRTLLTPILNPKRNILTAQQSTGGEILENTTGFVTSTNVTLTYDTSTNVSGRGCIKGTHNATNSNRGLIIIKNNISPSTQYSVTLWAKAVVATPSTMFVHCDSYQDGTYKTGVSSIVVPTTPDFIKFTLTFVTHALANTIQIGFKITNTVSSDTFNVDKIQLEKGLPTEWVIGSG